MNFDFIVKILIYLVIVRIIMSKVNKNKKKRSNNRRGNTVKTPNMPRSVRTQRDKVKGVEEYRNRNLEIKQIKDLFPKSNKHLEPMEKMAAREKELESMNKR